MGITQNRLCTYAVKRLQISRDRLEQAQAARCVHVPEVRGHDRAFSPTERDGVLEMATQGQ